jgi:hypothetical protein
MEICVQFFIFFKKDHRILGALETGKGSEKRRNQYLI